MDGRTRGNSRWDAWALGLTAMLACLLASCTTQAPSPRPSQTGTQAPGRLTWMLTRAALASVLSDPAARSRLDGAPVYQILQTGQHPLGAIPAVPVVTVSSVSELAQTLSGRRLPTGTRAVLYDPEAWPFTPVAEQRDPAKAAQQALRLAHAHGLRLFVAPALNLTTLRPGSGPRWQQFLRLGLAGAMAKAADVIELQAQSLERDTGSYAAFVHEAARQARAANPRVTILAGLSTNPPGAEVTSQQLTAAIRATSGVVSGYWLNIPGRGQRCPRCNAPRPDLARQLLGALP
ncbi:MAG TPA: hypothetical protein VIP48_12760 [Streptosporangiaceae bacterium]